MKLDKETESHAALARGYSLQSKDSSRVEDVLSGGKSLLGDPSQETMSQIGIEPGEYYWTFANSWDRRLGTRSSERIKITELNSGDIFSMWFGEAINTGEKFLVTSIIKSHSTHDSHIYNIEIINIGTGKQIAASKVDLVCRYRPTKDEELLLIPYMV